MASKPALPFTFSKTTDLVASGDARTPLNEPKRLLVYGKAGTGKTMAACRAAIDIKAPLHKVWDGEADLIGDPSVFVLTMEANGVDAARAMNPQAVLPEFESATGRPRYFSTTYTETQSVIYAASVGALQDQGITSLVIDGLTEMQLQILDQMYPGGVPEDINWMGWNDAMRSALRMIRSLPLDVYVTALAQEKELEKGKGLSVLPDMQGRKIPAEVPQYFDAVALLMKGENPVTGEIDHVAHFTLPGRYTTKECRSLRGVCRPSLSAWAEVLRQNLPPDVVRFPLPGSED